MNFVFASTHFTFYCQKVFWPSGVWLWLSSSKLRHALFGTKFWLSISPSFKFFITPLTSENRFFRWVFFVLPSTFFGTIHLFSVPSKKLLFAVFAYFRSCFYFSFALMIVRIFFLIISPTFTTTKFSLSSGIVAVIKNIPALLTNDFIAFISSFCLSGTFPRAVFSRSIFSVIFCYKFLAALLANEKFFHDLIQNKNPRQNRIIVQIIQWQGFCRYFTMNNNAVNCIIWTG